MHEAFCRGVRDRASTRLVCSIPGWGNKTVDGLFYPSIYHSRLVYSFRLFFIELSAFSGLHIYILQSYSRGQSSTTEWWVGPVTNRTQSPSLSTTLELNRTSSCYLATLSASMEIDVREIKGNSEIQTSVSLHWDGAWGKLAWCVVNVSQSTEYYPPTVPRLTAIRTRVCFETNNARYNSQRTALKAWINHFDFSVLWGCFFCGFFFVIMRYNQRL